MKPREGCSMTILISISLLAAAGILSIFIPSVIYDCYWPFVTVFVHFFAPFPPSLCAASSFEERENDVGYLIAAFLMTALIVSGYAICIIMYHIGKIPQIVIFFNIAGATCLLASGIIFVKVFMTCGRVWGQDRS